MRFRHRRSKLSPIALAASMLCAVILGGCRSDLYENLDQRQANEIVATLLRNHIYAARAHRDNGFAVVVDDGDFAKAMQILDANGLPRQIFKDICEVFKKDGLVSSPIQERAQMICALSQELSKTVSEVDGVLSARVHIVLPENDPLRQQLIPSSASVFVRHKASAQIADQVPQIKILVANGIAGLTYDKVSVILVPEEAARTEETGTDDLVLFWGLWMKKDSVAWAGFLIYGLIGLVIALASGIGYFTWRKMRKVYRLPAAAGAKAQ
jgi:type III secretion protein J